LKTTGEIFVAAGFELMSRFANRYVAIVGFSSPKAE
jgi:hypothetical protein